MSLLNLFFLKKIRNVDRKELDLFLWHCENQFFENGIMSISREQKMYFLNTLGVFNEGAATNSENQYIYDFFQSLFKFTDAEFEQHLEHLNIEVMLKSLSNIRMEGRIGIVLIVHCMLYIDRKVPSTKHISTANNVFNLIGVTHESYQRLIEKFKAVGEKRYPTVSHIFSVRI